ncbi:hypothetical protein AAC387_Pa10g0160 [Persea americana]
MEAGEGDGGLELSIELGEALEALDMCGELETMPERPECLVKDWAMEVCIRNSSKIVGLRDQYYYDLMSHHHFRSKKDIEYFLLTRMIRRYTPNSKKYATNKHSSFRSLNQDDSVLKQRSELRYDFKNHPTKGSWVLTNFSEGMWTSCKEGHRSLHGIHGWPRWKTSTVACMNFIREGDGGLDLSIVLGEGLEAPERCGESVTMLERLESLFKDWAMEVCIRSSRKIVGVRDQYYYDPMSHHHFRSKKDVEYFLFTGMIRRYTPKSKKPATHKHQQSELRFDFKNHPTKVSLVFSNFSEGMRTSCKEGRQSRHGIHGPQWKTSTVTA